MKLAETGASGGIKLPIATAVSLVTDTTKMLARDSTARNMLLEGLRAVPLREHIAQAASLGAMILGMTVGKWWAKTRVSRAGGNGGWACPTPCAARWRTRRSRIFRVNQGGHRRGTETVVSTPHPRERTCAGSSPERRRFRVVAQALCGDDVLYLYKSMLVSPRFAVVSRVICCGARAPSRK